MKLKKRIDKFYRHKIMPRLQKAIGLDEIESNLYLFLDSATDITKCKPATGILRTLQLADTEMLKIVDLLCRKNHLTYWLDWGSLLGAIRHKGFIPWDDDLDISLPQEDYRKLYYVLQDFCNAHPGFYCADETTADHGYLYLNYKANGMHLDIYPIDDFNPSENCPEEVFQKELTACWGSDRHYLQPNTRAEAADMPKVYYYSKHVWFRIVHFLQQDIFPVRETEFEGLSFFVPQNSHKYLSTIYGDYMAFPRNSVLKHKMLLACASKTENEQLSADYKAIKDIRIALQNNV